MKGLLCVLRVNPTRIVKLPEEIKVSGVHKDGRKDKEDSNGMIVKVGLRTTTGEVKEGPADAHKDADDHLRELDLGDTLCPGRNDATRTEVVIVIHKGVDEGIDGEENPTDGDVSVCHVPRVEKDGGMVVPVEEDDAFLLEDEKEGIKEFDDLCEGKEPGAKELESNPKSLFFDHADAAVETACEVDVDDVGGDVCKHNE